jgi:hypothetical protein
MDKRVKWKFVSVIALDGFEEVQPVIETENFFSSLMIYCEKCGKVWCRIEAFLIQDDKLQPMKWSARAIKCNQCEAPAFLFDYVQRIQYNWDNLPPPGLRVNFNYKFVLRELNLAIAFLQKQT